MKKINLLLSTILVLFIFTNCSEDFLETNPTTSLSDETLKKTPEGVEGILEGIHSMFYTYSFGQGFGTGAASINTQLDFMGNSVINSRPAYFVSRYRWTDHRDPDGYINYYTWDYYYTLIQHCNTVLGITENLEMKDVKKLNTLKGEAHIIRAYCYNQLVQLFGKRYEKGGDNSTLGAILRLDANIDPMPRSTVGETYNQINKDVKIALEELKNADLTGRKNRITLATAYGIAARTALAQYDYENVITYTELAISNFEGRLQRGSELLDGFNNFEAVEWMWGYRQATDQNFYYGGYGAHYAYNYNKGRNKYLRFAINRSYYDKMGVNDIRRKWFVALDQDDKIPDDAGALYFRGGYSWPEWETTGQCIKFKTKEKTTTFIDNCIMRLGEMYYMLAEAQAQLGHLEDAINTLETVMNARDPEYKVAESLSKDELIDEILRNKRIDLYWEGLEFFDMKRLGQLPDRLKSGNDKYMTTQQKEMFIQRNTGGFADMIPKSIDDKAWVFRIPYSEIKGNKLCEQNP